jgi:hypothetical protein
MNLKSYYYTLGAAMTVGMISSGEAHAANFSDIAKNINTSGESLPGLITGLSYLVGITMGVLGVMKIKDHVENPAQTKLKDGAIRLGAGGALFALPIIFESMFETIGEGTSVDAAALKKVKFNVN